jgi:hypothetical protein
MARCSCPPWRRDARARPGPPQARPAGHVAYSSRAPRSTPGWWAGPWFVGRWHRCRCDRGERRPLAGGDRPAARRGGRDEPVDDVEDNGRPTEPPTTGRWVGLGVPHVEPAEALEHLQADSDRQRRPGPAGHAEVGRAARLRLPRNLAEDRVSNVARSGVARGAGRAPSTSGDGERKPSLPSTIPTRSPPLGGVQPVRSGL